MRLHRISALFTGLLIVGCAGGDSEAYDGGGDTTTMAVGEASEADRAGLDAVGDYYETHFNMHHASMVAETFDTEESGGMFADGTIAPGPEAVLARLEAQMAGTPTLDLNTTDYMVFGDVAVGYGDYSVETTPPGGETMTLSGHWLGEFRRQADDTWKIGWTTTNYDHDWPEGGTSGPQPDEAPPAEGTMTDLTNGWATHYNLGHASMVADYHTEDGFAAFSNGPVLNGRAAIEADLAARMESAPVDIEIYDIATTQLADGWALDAGWYELSAKEGGDVVQAGTYMALAREADDGTWQTHWFVSNGVPAGAMEG